MLRCWKTCVLGSVFLAMLAWIPLVADGDTLEVMIWEDTELNLDELLDAIRDFGSASRVDIELTWVGVAEYRKALMERFNQGDPPDLFWASPDLLAELAQEGLVAPFDPVLRSVSSDLLNPEFRIAGLNFGLRAATSGPYENIAYAISRGSEALRVKAVDFVQALLPRWQAICCLRLFQPNPDLNTAIAAHGNTDWHIDTANEFLFGTDMGGSLTAPNHAPASWTRRHIHIGLTNTNHFYHDSDRITPGDDTNSTSGIDTAMLFFYAGHGFPPSSWDTLGNRANVANVSIGDRPGWGQLRYYWQCSCTVFAHGPSCCPGDSCHATHPCPDAQDWWYQCPGSFTGASDSLTTPNIYDRWGAAINPDLRMACGASTCAYCHQGQVNSIWNNYNNLGYDVADSFIDGLRVGSVVPICITMGGYNVNLTPLVTDTAFTNLPNTSGTSHYHIQYLSSFASKQVSGFFVPELPRLLPKLGILIPRPIPRRFLDFEFRIEKEWLISPEEIEGRGPRVRINQNSGSIYLAGPSQPVGAPPILDEEEYIHHAWSLIHEYGWEEELLSEPEGARLMIASVPAEEPSSQQEHAQKSVIITFKRQVEVEGVRVDVLGEGGAIEVQLNNDGSLRNASKVWREVIDFAEWEPVKPFEEALDEARKELEAPWAYEPAEWAFGYVEEAGNVFQDAMRLVFRFWFMPIDAELLREYPPVMIEISA